MARQLLESTRMELFSDGVFAIAATLLVVEVAVPVVGEGQLGHALRQGFPAYIAYAVSFAVIGVHWVNHHASMDRIANLVGGTMQASSSARTAPISSLA